MGWGGGVVVVFCRQSVTLKQRTCMVGRESWGGGGGGLPRSRSDSVLRSFPARPQRKYCTVAVYCKYSVENV